MRKITIKIGEFPSKVTIKVKKGIGQGEGKKYDLPERIVIKLQRKDKVKYGYRLFHLHSEATAEKYHHNLKSDLRDSLEIICPANQDEENAIKRFWIVKEGFESEGEALNWRDDISHYLNAVEQRKVQIEGGIYKIYPERVQGTIAISSLSREKIFAGGKFGLRSAEGIEILEAPVGEGFHWERRENLQFQGTIFAQAGENGVLIVNEIDLEDYLCSVNSSEMSALAPVEFLKSQTIAARGTVLATLGCHHYGEPYDLCNGDHCQCYYGSSRVDSASREAGEATEGLVLMYNGTVADTRYAKICGGWRERFSEVWEDFDPPYLPTTFDGAENQIKVGEISEYLNNPPPCYCNPNCYPYPEYFADIQKWFRWEIKYNREELADIINRKTGSKFDEFSGLEIISRGNSGRINGLRILGGRNLEAFGELNIRRVLSSSHLPSSCFEVSSEGEEIRLRGAGWGHGVGMCQMGALNMALKGFKCEQILSHYYPGCEMKKIVD